MENKNIEKLLRELVDEMRILTASVKAEAFNKFKREFLSSELRNKMYEAFDGERTLQQISSDIGCKLNTLQVFGQQLVDDDLVNFEVKSNARILSKSLPKIALFYANKENKGE